MIILRGSDTSAITAGNIHDLTLTNDYKQFVVNFNMNNMEKTIPELHSMLKTVELSMGSNNPKYILTVEGGVRKKWHNKKGKGSFKPNQHPKGKGKGKQDQTSQNSQDK